ncbi:MAG: right-handed parallel beta-helix repeat-containing protein [Patescibacteria group bacterium]
MSTLTFFKTEKVIQVDSPQTTVTCQDLINQIRLYEENLNNLDYGHIANAYGKQALGGGSYIGITLELVNDWRIAFEARSGPDTIACTVSGGNLVAINQYGNNPLKATAFTQVNIAQSSSPTIIQADANYGMLYMLESLRGRNRSVGAIWYWNPTTGNDNNDGLTPSNAVATFAKAQTLATAGAGDIIFALSTASGGVTTTNEKLSITKAGLKVRGAGYAFQLIPITTGSPTVSITADSVEFEGFFVKTASGGTDDGIVITGNNVLIKDCWINQATGNGLQISDSARTQIDTCVIEDSSGTGIKIGNSTTNLKVRQSIVSGNGADGIDLSGTGLTDNIFESNLIFNNTGYGIDIGSGVARTGVRLNHTFSGNTLGATRDAGTGTFIETPAGGESASAIADAVWDEVIVGHATPGSAGQVLKATKLKATLASLK